MVDIQTLPDSRGEITLFNFRDLPKKPIRFFTIATNVDGLVRGGHGHLKAWQYFYALEGEISICLHSQNFFQIITLDDKSKSKLLIVPPKTYSKQQYSSLHSKLLVMTTEEFDENEYFYDVSCECFHSSFLGN